MKKFLSIVLSILMVVTTVPYAFAAATVASGTCGADGSNVSWELDSDGVLTFSGEGATQDYPGPNLSPIYFYKDDVKKIVVNDGVTRLGTYVCFMFTEVTEVSLPESLVSIGENVFAYFKALESIELPDSLTTIGIGAFQGCAFKSITIPEGVTTIDASVFQSCQALETVTFHEGLTTIGKSAFYYCDSLKSISIPASVTTIGEGAFELCDSLESVYVPCSWENNPLYSGFGTALIIADHSIEDGVCSACGCDCPHKNITDGKCDSCGTEGTIVTIEMTDSYGDGWNGNKIAIKQFVDGVYTDTEAGTATIEYGAGGTFTTVLPKDGIFALSWLAGDYPSECSFTIAVDGETVYECVDGSTLTDGQMIYVTCEHTSYTDGKCDVCGYECPHSSFDAATGNCTDCETSLAIAKIETGETTTYYQTADELRTAIENNYADQAITLLADLAIKDTIFIENFDGTKNTLDLNGHTLICSDPIGERILVEYGELEITGTGSINIFMSANDEGTKIVVGSGVTLNNSLRSAYGGVLELTNATIPEAGLNVILYSDYWDPTTYNVSDVLKLPADYYFFVDGKAVSSYSGETEGTVLKHADHSYTYTDNGDGTHDATCSACGAVVYNEAHSGGTATCTELAKCKHCGASYGEVDKNNHDETVAYVNGFCPNCDAYEPAELVDGVYQISNAGNLYWFADKVTNENAAYGSADAILTCDIRVNEGTMTEGSTDARVWTPIGKHGFGVNIPYTGTFEGNGKTVSGLYFNDTSANFSVGLFSLVGEGGKVQNVGIADSYLCGSQNIGAVAGSNRGTVTGCYNTGTVSGTNYVGGVVGYNYGTATNCYNTGIISGTSYVGGVVGSNHGTVTDCHNTGAVSGSGTVGGVVGYNSGTATNCYNTGIISGSNDVGGVVGDNEDTVTGCYNTGTVSGTTAVGGVVGHNWTAVTNCYNTGTVSGTTDVGGVVGTNWTTVTNCYNTGTVSGTSSVGGVVGYNISDTVTVTNCYFDSTVYTGDAIGNNYGTATDVEGKSTAQFASGEVAYLLSQGENGSIWGQTIGTDPAPVFSDAKVYYGYTSCGDTVAKYTNDETISAEKPDHTQKPTFTDNGNGTHSAVYPCCGTTVTEEHDFENDAHQCVCGYACPHDSYTDGVCDNCDYECPHEWGEGVLTRPTFETAGYYTYTCTLCGNSYTEPTKKADDTALNDASMKVTEYIDNDTLTQEARDEIYKSYRDILKNNGNIFDEFGFVRGDLVEEDQPAINAVTAELEKIIADADEKIASGEYVKADYTEIDEAIDDIEEKLASENVTDEGKAELEEIKKQLEEMKADENTSAADVAELEKALEDYEEELDKGIEDGTLVEVDVDAIADDVNKKWAEKLEAEGLLDEYEDFINNQKATDEAMATVDEINDFANSLEGTVAENAENIAKLNEMLDSLYSSFENCLRGTHNFKDYEITSPAKCEVNAKETSTCWFCGETDEREVEGTALSHSFTKYEVTEEAKCGVAGKEVAYCDNGCQTTDERETPALEHIFLDYVSNGDATCTADGTKTASCLNGCGATDTVADEGSMIDHSDEDGDKLCDDCGEEVYDRCDICGGKAHGDDKIQLVFCMIITIIRFVTSILKSIN